jgi:ABC-type proline/glycine betaine transport system substrate-binding protein
LATDCPDVAKLLSGSQLDDASLSSRENLVINKYGQGHEDAAVTEWLKTHQDSMHAKAG